MDRQALRDFRENAIIQEFVQWLNAHESTDLRIVERPDPPDAILTCSSAVTWMELTDIVRNKDEAEELFSYMATGSPTHRHEGLAINGNDVLPEVFLATLHNKLVKTSYLDVYKKYGRGILLLNEVDPLFDESTLELIIEAVELYLDDNPGGGYGYFRPVYFRHWDNAAQVYTYTKLTSFPVLRNSEQAQ